MYYFCDFFLKSVNSNYMKQIHFTNFDLEHIDYGH